MERKAVFRAKYIKWPPRYFSIRSIYEKTQRPERKFPTLFSPPLPSPSGRGEASARQARKNFVLLPLQGGRLPLWSNRKEGTGVIGGAPGEKKKLGDDDDDISLASSHDDLLFPPPPTSSFLPLPRRSVGRKALAVGVAVAVVTYDWPE